jgi:hypothetical protein
MRRELALNGKHLQAMGSGPATLVGEDNTLVSLFIPTPTDALPPLQARTAVV